MNSSDSSSLVKKAADALDLKRTQASERLAATETEIERLANAFWNLCETSDVASIRTPDRWVNIRKKNSSRKVPIWSITHTRYALTADRRLADATSNPDVYDETSFHFIHQDDADAVLQVLRDEFLP